VDSAQLLSTAVRSVVGHWIAATTYEEKEAAFEDTAALGQEFGAAVEESLVAAGIEPDVVRKKTLIAACTHLKDVFQLGELPDTPQDFLYVPDVNGTFAGRAAALATHGFLKLETISYGSENDGELFVNLVPMPGEGRIPDKSKDKMRGHTDAVSFPFSGETDAIHPRIAPSPDFVTLVGMRNPNSVGTTVMPLEEILPRLSQGEISELKIAQYDVGSQDTFVVGLIAELGKTHTLLNAPVLRVVEDMTQVRFSHRNVNPPEDYPPGKQAIDRFKEACELVAHSVVVGPGDLLLVSNRTCLHGRGIVGEDVGGKARWLLRTYALDTTGLDDARRHGGDRPVHVLYP
jgi:L-asparagine oxygenase